MSEIRAEVAVVLIGLGAVGKAVVRHLHVCDARDHVPHVPFDVKKLFVIDRGSNFGTRSAKKAFLKKHFPDASLVFAFNSDEALSALKIACGAASTEADFIVVIECTGAKEKEFRKLYEHCLAERIPVITANKAFLVTHSDLLDKFHAEKVPLLFEAAVGGGMPVVKLLRDTFGSDRVGLIAGILNGTTNYILSMMEMGLGFDEALRKARERKLAEASDGTHDPASDADLNGRDGYAKISLLARLVWGRTPLPLQESHLHGLPASFVRRSDIRYAKEKLKAGIRFVGVVRQLVESSGRRSIDVFFTPALLPESHELCQVHGENNALLIASDFTGSTLCVGPGAGPSPTANAVVSDLLFVARELALDPAATQRGAGALTSEADEKVDVREFSALEFGGYYIRLVVKDEAGLLGKITQIVGDAGVNVGEVLQLDHSAAEIQELLASGGKSDAGLNVWGYLPFVMMLESSNVGKILSIAERLKNTLGDKLAVAPVIVPILDIPRVNGWQKRGGLDELEEWSDEAAENFHEKYSVDLFPERYLDSTQSRANAILQHEKNVLLRARTGETDEKVQRIFVFDSKLTAAQQEQIMLPHKNAGVDVRRVGIDLAKPYLRRLEDGFLRDFAVYKDKEVVIVELADANAEVVTSTSQGYQVYGSAELAWYMRTFQKLWAIANKT